DLVVDRILGEVDELLSMLRGEQPRELSLRQSVLEQNLSQTPPAVRRLRKCAVDGLERHQARAIDERPERIAPHLGGAVRGIGRRSLRRLAHFNHLHCRSSPQKRVVRWRLGVYPLSS